MLLRYCIQCNRSAKGSQTVKAGLNQKNAACRSCLRRMSIRSRGGKVVTWLFVLMVNPILQMVPISTRMAMHMQKMDFVMRSEKPRCREKLFGVVLRYPTLNSWIIGRRKNRNSNIKLNSQFFRCGIFPKQRSAIPTPPTIFSEFITSHPDEDQYYSGA